MPFYDLLCPASHTIDGKTAEGGYRFEALLALNAPTPPCEICSGPTEKVWGGKHYGTDPTFPLVTKVFDGKPRIVESRREMERLGKERGWALRDDPSWLDEGDYEGAKWEYDPRKGRKGWVQHYSKTSIPGSWQFDWSNHPEVAG